jgi:hypothetical protein
MADQLIANGQYKIHGRFGALTNGPEAAHAFMTPEESDGSLWEIAHVGDDCYTLRNRKTAKYLGSTQGDPKTMAPLLEGTSEPFAWKIARHPAGAGYTLSPKSSDGGTHLDQSPIKIFPPPVAWMPTVAEAVFPWRLSKV